MKEKDETRFVNPVHFEYTYFGKSFAIEIDIDNFLAKCRSTNSRS